MNFTLRNVLLFLHISMVASWLGADILQFVIAPRLKKAGAELEWMRIVHFLHEKYYFTIAILILATGIGLVQESEAYDWSSKFIYMGFAAIALGASIGGGYLKSTSGKVVAALEAGNAAEAESQGKRMLAPEIFLTGFAFLTVLAMVSKWGL